MRSIEQQIDEFVLAARVPGLDSIRKAARDLLEGKFAEEPVPEIELPAGLRFIGSLHQTYDELSWYVMGEVGEIKLRGPNRSSKAEAVKAWNAGIKGD